MKNCIIFTGCSCSGKTTLFNELKKDKLNTSISECASNIIKKYQKENIKLPWETKNINDSLKFQLEILNEQYNLLSNIDLYNKKNLILDRSFEDIIGYMSLYLNIDFSFWRWPITKTYLNNISKFKFYVFVLQPIKFEYNGVRNSNLKNERQKEYDTILNVYKKCFNESEIHIEKEPLDIQSRLNWVNSICT